MEKPRKVEESPGAYTASKQEKSSTEPTVRRADDQAFRKAADKVFETRKELFRRLAQ